MSHETYDKLFINAPPVAPFGADSAAWLAAYLGRFDAQRLAEASTLAQAVNTEELQDTKKLRDFLAGVWDSVSRELDCTDLSEEEQEELSGLETQLAESVHSLRAMAGY